MMSLEETLTAMQRRIDELERRLQRYEAQTALSFAGLQIAPSPYLGTDIRTTAGLRAGAYNSVGTPIGASFEAYPDTDANYPGQFYFNAGATASSDIVFMVGGGATLGFVLKASGALLFGRYTGLTGYGDVDVAGKLRVGSQVGFYGTTPIAKPTVSGAKASNAALTSLCTALASLGLITNSTT